MRTFFNVQAVISADNDQRQNYLNLLTQAFDDSDPSISSVYHADTLMLQPSAVDVPFNFGAVSSASVVFIIAQQECTVKLNSTVSSPANVRPTPAVSTGTVLSNLQKFSQPGIVLWRGKVGALYFANPSASTVANVFVALVGNAS